MKETLPFSPDESPTVILELIYQLKIKDVMSRKLITAERSESLRSVQAKLKANGITGLPVAEKDRLFGIVSVDDIIQALEGGWIDDQVKDHMTSNVILLEEDMPLSFAITYLNRYKFGRFPVINKEKRLVGIITSRDISSHLLTEINREVVKLENQLKNAMPETLPTGALHKEYIVRKFDFETAGHASTDLKKILKSKNIDRKIIRRAAIASYELEINEVVHSTGGNIILMLDEKSICITARDTGPGIPDLEKALTEGFSTANDWIRSLGFGAGMGLANVKRVSDEFTILSGPDGTFVRSIIHIKQEPPNKETIPQ